MVLICAEHVINNRDAFVIAEQDLHRDKAFSAFHTATLVKKLRLCGRLEKPGQGTQTNQRDIPDHRTSWSVYKTGDEKEEMYGTFGVRAFVFPSTATCNGAQLSWRRLNTGASGLFRQQQVMFTLREQQ